MALSYHERKDKENIKKLSFGISKNYILLMSLLSVYLLHYAGKAYLPSIISFSIAILIFAASFVVAAAANAWYGIGLGMLAAGVFGCSIIILLFIFIYQRFVK